MSDSTTEDLESEVRHLEDRLYQAEETIIGLREKMENIAQVVAAVSDDTLRACFVLEELALAGLVPSPLPWDLGSTLVELQHAMKAKENGTKDYYKQPVDLAIQELKEKVATLRASLEKVGHG